MLNQLGFIVCMLMASAAWVSVGYLYCQTRHDDGGGDVAPPTVTPAPPDYVPDDWAFRFPNQGGGDSTPTPTQVGTPSASWVGYSYTPQG